MRHLLTLLARSLCALFYTQKPILYFIAKEQLGIFEVSSHAKTVSSRAWHTTVQNTSTSSIPASYHVVHSTMLTAISQEPLMLSKYVILINVIICNMSQVGICFSSCSPGFHCKTARHHQRNHRCGGSSAEHHRTPSARTSQPTGAYCEQSVDKHHPLEYRKGTVYRRL